MKVPQSLKRIDNAAKSPVVGIVLTVLAISLHYLPSASANGDGDKSKSVVVAPTVAKPAEPVKADPAPQDKDAKAGVETETAADGGPPLKFRKFLTETKPGAFKGFRRSTE